MNLKKELENMNISDLRFICRELGIPYPKTKSGIIKKLLEPLSRKYGMQLFENDWSVFEYSDQSNDYQPMQRNSPPPKALQTELKYVFQYNYENFLNLIHDVTAQYINLRHDFGLERTSRGELKFLEEYGEGLILLHNQLWDSLNGTNDEKIEILKNAYSTFYEHQSGTAYEQDNGKNLHINSSLYKYDFSYKQDYKIKIGVMQYKPIYFFIFYELQQQLIRFRKENPDFKLADGYYETMPGSKKEYYWQYYIKVVTPDSNDWRSNTVREIIPGKKYYDKQAKEQKVRQLMESKNVDRYTAIRML